MTAESSGITELLQSIQSDYLEMPGLCLTGEEARRLWGIDRETCEDLLETLVAARFLRVTAKRGYVLDGPSA